MSYVDGFVLPLKDENKERYAEMARTFAEKSKACGALGTIESLGDGLEHGHTTDFFRAVKAEEGENVVFSIVVWPDKATRDAGWEKIMSDPDFAEPPKDMPFDGKRMFWGGFTPLLNTWEDEA